MEHNFWFQNLIYRLKSRFFIISGIIIVGFSIISATDVLGKLKIWAAGEIGMPKDNFQLAAVIELGKTPESQNKPQNNLLPLPAPKKIETKIQSKNEEQAASTSIAEQPLISEIKNCSFATNQNPAHQPVIMNEIAWMGSMLSANDEWIELRNISDDTVSLQGWQLKDKGEQISVLFDASFSIEPRGFMLLERTDDNSVPAIAADTIYVGALSNSNEGIRLFDPECHLIDEVIALPDWPAGNPGERRTMERHMSFSWYTYTGNGVNGINGTPLAENSVPLISTSSNPIPFSQTDPAETANAVSTSTAEISPASSIATLMITEVQVSGVTINDEFIELYNPTDIVVALTDWSLKRKSSSGTEYSLVPKSRLEGKSIAPQSHFLLANEEGYAGAVTADVQWAKSNTIANNNTVILYGPDGGVIDKVGFGEAQDFEGTAAQNPESGQSLTRQNNIDSNDNGKDFIGNIPTPKS